jgi:hypothetical protein
MLAVQVVAERALYLLLAKQNRYAVVERRAGQLYAVHGLRRSAPMRRGSRSRERLVG